MDEFRTMQTLMLKVQKQAKAIKKIQEITLPNLRQQLAETTGTSRARNARLWKNRYSRPNPSLKKN